MGKIRGELEDMAFAYIDPHAYREIREEIEEKRRYSEDLLKEMASAIEQKLQENGLQARVEWRIKRLYSTYKKMKRQKEDLSQIYDLLAVRIITQSVNDCYAAMGVVHSVWSPVPGRIKDFIAMPRPNLYQSLHTTVIGKSGQPVEVQIRTEEMHRTAEEGIAALVKSQAMVASSFDMRASSAWASRPSR